MSLEELQQRLEGHFSALRDQRASASEKQPIFALEHGLDAEDLTRLYQHIFSEIARGPPLKRHSLPWIVYAAEIGYRYSGDEYWQTFDSEIPPWTWNGSRSWIRRRFEEFHKQFGGAKPTGRWAEWFTNICWPITHAILPKDLQRQLAKVLYENRHAFSRDLLESPVRLGALIAARSLNASTRFQKLAQQPLLLGQIATALLLEDKNDGKSLILPSTLRRIAEDLERERQAKAWLSGARQHINTTRLRAVGAISKPHIGGTSAGTEAEPSLAQPDLGLELRMMVQPTGPAAFDLYAEIPNLSPLLIRFPELGEILNESRCVVAGAADPRPLYQGRVLRRHQIVRLATWPSGNEPLFRFERTHPKLDYLLSAESFRRPGEQWLFRIALDGRGYELRSLNVRAGGKYLLLRSQPFADQFEGARSVAVNCNGVHALELSVPATVNDEWAGRLKSLDLNHAKILDVWPAGTPPAAWDGERRVEWLSTDVPILAVRSDHALEDLTVLLDSNEWSRIQFGRVVPGKTNFIELPDLPLGLHKLTFRPQTNERRIAHESIHLNVFIREPHEWVPGVTAQGAFLVLMDPPSPTLEQLWEGRAAVEIHGPDGRQVSGSVTLFERALDQQIAQVVLPSLSLPVSAEQWEQHFGKHIRSTKAVANNYDMAQTCVIELKAEELGKYRIECERKFEPVRWALRRGIDCYQVKVVSDRGDDEALTVVSYDLLRPESAIALDATANEYSVPLFGCLYTATSDRFTNSILVPPFQVRSFADLKVKTEIDITDHSANHLLALLAAAELWAASRIAGSDVLASIQIRNRVVDAILRAIAASIAGPAWQKEERIYNKRSDPGAISRLCQNIPVKVSENAMAAVIERDMAAIAALPIRTRIARLRDLTSKFLGVSNPYLVEFALRVASGCVRKWAGESAEKGIEQLHKRPVVMRVARAVVLGVDACVTREASNVGPVYAGWQWE